MAVISLINEKIAELDDIIDKTEVGLASHEKSMESLLQHLKSHYETPVDSDIKDDVDDDIKRIITTDPSIDTLVDNYKLIVDTRDKVIKKTELLEKQILDINAYLRDNAPSLRGVDTTNRAAIDLHFQRVGGIIFEKYKLVRKLQEYLPKIKNIIRGSLLNITNTIKYIIDLRTKLDELKEKRTSYTRMGDNYTEEQKTINSKVEMLTERLDNLERMIFSGGKSRIRKTMKPTRKGRRPDSKRQKRPNTRKHY